MPWRSTAPLLGAVHVLPGGRRPPEPRRLVHAVLGGRGAHKRAHVCCYACTTVLASPAAPSAPAAPAVPAASLETGPTSTTTMTTTAPRNFRYRAKLGDDNVRAAYTTLLRLHYFATARAPSSCSSFFDCTCFDRFYSYSDYCCDVFRVTSAGPTDLRRTRTGWPTDV